ncbi:histidine kinase/DNA gyrase B/HSP90-like ATPase [Anaeroplasma bactoclasticum]|jgi:sensor histidine kinase YesM|uniref:Histidine kinase/DNA gyrase B/HSP90-like ATPase n=1 Tax=Anaeroplasma bactoclasticum TaxID=2088 RepID=A0A397QW91_9MOLU|nr:histidine kinase [Anaeroplasma bactoclasticum]RIA65039.1 histidine kinase/DNA gyrase B/HSP90-like ATPase [Anaeroplasma bactoclasticum]
MSGFLHYFNDHFILFVLSISLLVILFVASKINKKDKRLLISIVFYILCLAIFEYLETLFNDSVVHEENFPRYLFSSLCYIIRPMIICLFYHIRLDFKNKKSYFIWIGVAVNTIIYLLALFAYKNPSMRLVFWYNSQNNFDRTWLGYTVYVICALYLVSLIVASIIETTIKKTKRQIDIIIIITASIAILTAVNTIVLKLEYSYTSEAYVLGAILYFLYLSFQKASSDAVKYERDMQEKTTFLMLSQIQPHFVYNTLTTIQVLCEIDPEKAAETIDYFSKYLRMNTDALSKTTPVPVEEEINHAKAYSKIEMVRFDNVEVIFNVEDKDFKLPVLTIEPLVENAIKYGVRAKEKGIVEIKTYKSDKKHVLVIKDNGVGFNTNQINNDGKNHVGLNNVKMRVVNMVGGTFDVESIIGEGTTITITIPEEE